MQHVSTEGPKTPWVSKAWCKTNGQSEMPHSQFGAECLPEQASHFCGGWKIASLVCGVPVGLSRRDTPLQEAQLRAGTRSREGTDSQCCRGWGGPAPEWPQRSAVEARGGRRSGAPGGGHSVEAGAARRAAGAAERGVRRDPATAGGDACVRCLAWSGSRGADPGLGVGERVLVGAGSATEPSAARVGRATGECLGPGRCGWGQRKTL